MEKIQRLVHWICGKQRGYVAFAVYISGEDNVDGMKAKAVTTNILKDKGILK